MQSNRRAGKLSILTLIVFGIAWVAAFPAWAKGPTAPGDSFFSPQVSPDGRSVIWECLDRGGSIWIVREGSKASFLSEGHSPSWVDERHVQFVISRDDGHQILEQNLFTLDLEGSGGLQLLVADSDNPDYSCVKMPVEAPVWEDRPLSGKVVVLDPGHGNNTGARSPHTKIFEDEHVLDSAEVVRDYLEASGATVKLTRVDNSICPSLSSRVNFSNSAGAALFCSIHYNSASNQSAHGIELLYRSGVTGSKEQATKIHDRVKTATGLSSRGVKGDKTDLGFYLGVLSSSHKISRKCLTEGGFLSNESDAATIATPEFNERISWGIYAGICDTFGVAPNRPIALETQEIDEHFSGALDHAWIGSHARIRSMPTPEEDGKALVLESVPHRCAVLRSGGTAWKDYEVSAVVKGAGAAYGLLAHSTTASKRRFSGYLLVCDGEAGKAILFAAMGSLATLHPIAEAPLPVASLADGWRELSIRCEKGRIVASVDGMALSAAMHVSDEGSYWVAPRGKAGLFLVGTEGAAEMLVDRFLLRPLH